jgi:hypothetical protein
VEVAAAVGPEVRALAFASQSTGQLPSLHTIRSAIQGREPFVFTTPCILFEAVGFAVCITAIFSRVDHHTARCDARSWPSFHGLSTLTHAVHCTWRAVSRRIVQGCRAFAIVVERRRVFAAHTCMHTVCDTALTHPNRRTDCRHTQLQLARLCEGVTAWDFVVSRRDNGVCNCCCAPAASRRVIQTHVDNVSIRICEAASIACTSPTQQHKQRPHRSDGGSMGRRRRFGVARFDGS